MDLFNREKLSKFAETAGSAIAGAAKKAAAATKTAAVSVKEFAAEATEQAKHGVHAASNKMMGGSHALSLVGTEVTVRGKVLRIESLLAEGTYRSWQRDRSQRARSKPHAAARSPLSLSSSSSTLAHVQAALRACTWRASPTASASC